ncbi:MAG: hypothetical protein ACR2PK_08635 [Acidimicrobiales bacterium]
MADTTVSRWSRVYGAASWTLIGLFVFMAGAHVVLTVLFYTGVRDTGVGYFLDWEWPGWLITLIDAGVAALFWYAYRRGATRPGVGLVATLVAAIMALARAAWMILVPVLLIIALAGSVARLVRGPSPAART